MIERSGTGVWRIPLAMGWAIGFGRLPFDDGRWFRRYSYYNGGWSVRILWFHVGWKTDRENWTHFR